MGLEDFLKDSINNESSPKSQNSGLNQFMQDSGYKSSPYSEKTIVSEPKVHLPESEVESLKYYNVPLYVSQSDTWNEQRSQNQGTFAKLGSGLVNAISQTALDVFKDAGYLLDFENYADINKSAQEGFGNWFSDSIQSLEDKLKLPVYRTKQSLGFAPWTASWWGENLPSIFTTASMFIMPELGVKTLSQLGETLGGNKLVEAFAKIAGTESNVIKNSLKGITGAVISRHMESLMEGGQTFKDTYDQAIKSGKSEDEAKQIAGDAAAQNYKLNWVALLQDIPEYMFLHKSFGNSVSNLEKETKEVLERTFKDKALNLGKIGLLEGSEEMYQYITDKEAQRNALIKGKVIDDDKTIFEDRLLNYAKDGEFWTSGFLGALGGVGFGAYGLRQQRKGANEQLKYIQDQKDQYNKILELHKSILTSDPQAYNRSQDNLAFNHISNHIENGTLDKFQKGLEYLQKNHELSDKPQENAEVQRRIQKTLDSIKYANSIKNNISNDQTLSPELRKLKFGTILTQHQAEERFAEVQQKLAPILAKDLLHLPPDIHAYKQLKLTIEGLKDIPNMQSKVAELEKTLNDSVKELRKTYGKVGSSISGAKGELDKMTISSHDEELKKLLANKEIENEILNSTRNTLFNLNTEEGRNTYNQKIKENKEKLTKEFNSKLIKELAKQHTEDKQYDDETQEFINENKKEFDKEVKNLQKEKKKQEQNESKGLKTFKFNEDLTMQGEYWVDHKGQQYIKVKEGNKATSYPVKEVNGELIYNPTESTKENDTTKDKFEGINEQDVNNKNEQQNTGSTEVFKGKVALTPFKTEGGLDDDTTPSKKRYFDYIRNPEFKAGEHKLLVVTKLNNPDLYNEIHKEREATEKQYQEFTGDKDKGIYVVLVDKNLNHIKVDDKLIFATLTTPNRTDLKVSKEDREKLAKFREQLLSEKDTNIYLPITEISKGILQYEPVINGKRQSNSVIGRIIDSINKAVLKLVVNKAEGQKELGFIPGTNVLAKIGKLYIKDERGNYIDLVPRKLNEQEADIALNLIDQMLGNVQQGSTYKPKTELEKIVYFGIPKRGRHEYTITIREGKLLVGTKDEYTKEDFKNSEIREKVKQFLLNKHVNISNDYDLNSQTEFESPKYSDSQETTTYKSYKEYLLSGENPMFGTDLVDKSKVQVRNQYLIYTPNVIRPSIKEDTKKVEEQSIKEEKTTPKKKSTKLGPIKRKEDNKLDRTSTEELRSKPLLTEEEKQWFKTVLPKVPIEIVQGLIENKSFGRFISAGKVLLSSEATVGTLYHEAFHVVTQLYLTKSEVNALYKEAKQSYPNKSRLELEEILAEDFINYKETGKILNNRVARNNIFRRLLNFIKDLVGLSSKSIEDVYRRLDKGYYSNKIQVGNREFSQLEKQIEYKNEQGEIEKLSVTDTKYILDEVDACFWEIIRDNDLTVAEAEGNLFSKILAKIKDKLSDNEFIVNNWENIKSNWHDRILSLGNELDINEEDLEEQENLNKDEVAESRQGDALAESNTISPKSILNKETKALIRGLLEVDKEGNYKLTELNTRIPVNFSYTYNYLLNKLQGISDWVEMYNKISELSEDRPELKQLLQVLGQPSSDMSFEKFIQWQKFRQDFDKNKVEGFTTIIEIDPKTNKQIIYIVNKTAQAVNDKIKENWRSQLKDKAQYKNNEYIVNPEITDRKKHDDISFLNAIGITFTNNDIAKSYPEFTEAVNQIRSYVNKNKGNITGLFEKKSEIAGRIKSLLDIEGTLTQTINELSYLNSEDKTVYSITQNNALSIIKNIINNSNTKSELFNRLPHLNTISTEGSVWLDRLFDSEGIRNSEIQLDLELHDGLVKNSLKDPKKSSTKKLSIGEKYVQELNSILLNGKSSVIRTSDKGLEYIISLNKYDSKSKHIIPISELENGFNSKRVKNIFRNYFKAELKRIAYYKINGLGIDIEYYGNSSNKKANNVGGEFTIFNQIISKKVKNTVYDTLDNIKDTNDIDEVIDNIYNEVVNEVDENVVDYFNKYANELKTNLNKYQIKEGQGLITLKNKENKDYNLDTLIRTIAINDYINSIEQLKLFLGDMGFYTDLFKRTAGLVGTKESCSTGEEINNWLNKNNKREDKKVADDTINTVVFSDSKVSAEFISDYIKELINSGLSEKEANSILKPYLDMDEGDAQGWITLDEHEEFAIRRGKYNNKLKETYKRLKEGKADIKDIQYILTLKAQYFGPQEYKQGPNSIFVPTYHKYSLMPLIPQLIKGTNLEKLNEEMKNKKVGYALFKSGSKVGTKLNKDGKPTEFYNDNGEINTKDWINQKIYYNFLGIQVKSSEPKEQVIFGTQFKKLLFGDLFEDGSTKPEFKKLRDEYDRIISDLVEKEKTKLLKDIGANSKSYTIENVQALVKLLQKEAKSRNLTDNIIQALQAEEVKGQFILKYKLDTMVNKDKIDSMLMSLINSRLIRQKMNGDAYVQGSVAGFEQYGKRNIKKDHTLKFYRKENPNDPNSKTLDAQCKISLNLKTQGALLAQYGTLNKLNQAIKEGKIDKSLLQLVGYRIPTQGLNSMESLEIVEFLPPETNMIILPSEIVAKSGGDFDIDKLNIFRPNFKPSKIQSKHIIRTINEDLQRFNDIINDNTVESNLIKNIFSDTVRLIEADVEKEFKITKEELKKLQEYGGSITKLTHYYDTKNQENRIIEIAREILTHPDNFNQLITPNSVHILKNLSNKVEYEEYVNKKKEKNNKLKAEGKKEENIQEEEDWLKTKDQSKNIRYSDQLKLTTKIEQFYKFMLAKNMIGIAAIANTHHVISQQVNAYLNSTYKKQVYNKKSKQWETREISTDVRFPHNKTKEGNLSLAKQKDANGKYKISEIISQIISATVDAAKDPFMFSINMTSDTLPTYLYLTRIGVPFNLIGYFMRQPIITEYLQEISINKASYINKRTKNDEIKNKIQSKYYKQLKNKDFDPIFFEKEEQLSQYLKSENQQGEDFAKTQIQVLNDFLRYKEQASLLQKAVKASNHDTAGLGKNLAAAEQKLKEMKEVDSDDFFKGLDDILKNTFIGSMNLHQFVLDLYGPLYYTQEKQIKKVLSSLNDKILELNPYLLDTNKSKLRSLIENDFINYIVQNYGYKNVEEFNKIRQRIFKGDNSIAHQLIKAKENPKFKDNLLIKELVPLVAKGVKLFEQDNKVVESRISNIQLYGKRFDTYTAEQLTEAFRELQESDDPEAMQLAKGLMDVGIIQSGLNNSPITYLGLIPFEYYNDIVKTAFEEFNKKNGVKDIHKFAQLFIRNNSTNSLLYKIANSLKLNNYINKNNKFIRNNALGYSLTGKGNTQFGKDYTLDKYNNKLSNVIDSTYEDIVEEQDEEVEETENNIDTPTQEEFSDNFDMNKVEDEEDETPQYQKSNEKEISDNQLTEIATKLSDKFGIPYSIETPEVAMEYLKSEGVTEFSTLGDLPIAFYHKGIVVFVRGKATLDTPFHEFSHPFIDIIEKNNKPLFLNLKRQLNQTEEGKQIIEFVKRNYPKSVKNNELTNAGYKEAIVTALGKLAANQFNEIQSKGLVNALKQLLKRIGEYLQQLLSDKSKAISPLEIKANTTLEELATMLNLENKVDLNQQNQVNYSLKSVNTIINNLTKVNQWWNNKSIDKPTFWKKVQELGIPKEQLELLKETEGETIEDKLINFASNYSYTVEINTAKENKGDVLTTEEVKYGVNRYGLRLDDFINANIEHGYTAQQIIDSVRNSYLTLDNEALYFKYPEFQPEFQGDEGPIPQTTLEEVHKLIETESKKHPEQNSQYYSNLTVPGGTNYTENEIATPTITPSIKGHAQFATDNGIGWFRSDDLQRNIERPEYSIEHSPIGTKLMFNGEWVHTIQGEVTLEEALQDAGIPSYLKNTESDRRIRRILEVQSDLFQKGRDIKSPDEIIEQLKKEGKLQIKCD